jgi:hypothetical protein
MPLSDQRPTQHETFWAVWRRTMTILAFFVLAIYYVQHSDKFQNKGLGVKVLVVLAQTAGPVLAIAAWQTLDSRFVRRRSMSRLTRVFAYIILAGIWIIIFLAPMLAAVLFMKFVWPG